MNNTLLVDGHYLLKRSFLVKSNYYTHEFGNISGLFNFFLTLRTLTKELKINKILVCWDGENGGKQRHNICKNYKANRKNKSWYNKINLSEAEMKREQESKESLLKTKVRIQQYLEELFIRQLSVEFIEADDLIAYYCKLYHTTENITIFTNDRDLCQLIQYDTVKLYLANKKIVITKDNYFLHFNHHYKNIALIKTFCGDISDNIFNIDGLQEKTFLKLFPKAINEEMFIDEVIENAKLIKEERSLNKKLKPLLVLDAIIDGRGIDGKVLGRDFYSINYEIINLKEPMLTKEAKYEVENIATIELDDTDRGSKNLLMLMKEDGFMKVWNGSINDFCLPFYPVILKEKEYLKNNK
jgi:5'-3' exonuclease